MKKRLLWIGDAICSSGFARSTHKTLDTLHKSYDVTVLGINSLGTPHNYPYEIWPCYPGGDLFGAGRMVELINRVKPDVIVIQNDSWNIPPYLADEKTKGIPVVGAIAVDGKNCQGWTLNGLALSIFWTKFGEQEARQGGYIGQSAVVPLGVDLYVYRPLDKVEARIRTGLPARLRSAFIVGNVNRNQPRKRLDLTVSYFAEWIRTRKIDDAYLCVHIAPTGEDAYDLGQLMKYYGFSGYDNNVRLLESTPETYVGLPEEKLSQTYSMFDAMLTTTQGEGWGLTTMEGMACGVPQIVPDWSALGEWTEDAVIKVPCTEIAVTPTYQRSPTKINIIGGIPDRRATLEALDLLYSQRGVREKLSEAGLALVQKSEYRWENIGVAFKDAIEAALGWNISKKEELIHAG